MGPWRASRGLKMIKTKCSIFVAAGLVSSIAMQGGTTVQAETLSEALATAYTTNPSLLAQQSQLRAVDETVFQALSNWRPNVTLSGDIEREYTRLNTRTANRDQVRTPRNSTLVVTQPLFRGFRTINGLSGGSQCAGAACDPAGFEQNLLLQAATASWPLSGDEAVLGLTKTMNRSCDASWKPRKTVSGSVKLPEPT